VARLRAVPSWGVPLLAAVVVVVLPELGLSINDQRQVILIAILTLLVSGLNLSLGYAGELALGQVAVYASGAYVAGYLGAHHHTDLLLQLVVSGVLALVVGLVTGIPGLRLGSWSLAMTSFFLVLLIPDILNMLQGETGGALGLSGIGPSTLFGAQISAGGYYVCVTVVTVVWLGVLRNLVTSRHGTAFRVLRQSPVLASSMGISVYRMKLTAYALGALPAGLAGCFFANLDHYLSPDSFGFSLSIAILAASILGGSVSVYGAVVGATILQLGPLEATSFQQYDLVVYGAFLILGGVVLARGLAGASGQLWRRVQRRVPAAPAVAAVAAGGLDDIPGVELTVEGVSKSFGGLRALADVSLSAAAGEVTAVIGPNGSGKTTLLNLICGYYHLDEGSIAIGGEALRPSEAPHRIAQAGIARTFQTASIPTDVSVAEAVRSGRYTTEYSSMASAVLRLPSYRRIRGDDINQARVVLSQVGLDALAEREAASLPMGTRRLLEVARALIRRPRILLLDEAASGLDEEEVDHLADLIRQIRAAGGTVILVEHNFRLVLALADRIHVLAQGAIIASGTPTEIESNPAVLSEYLGVNTAATAADVVESGTAPGPADEH